jgi:CheY-like chemotaxis protein
MADNINHITVLIVDDDAVNALLARSLLKRVKPDAIIVDFQSGIHAIEYCYSNSSVDLILLDLNMPELTGYETAKQLRLIPDYSDVPIIALTASEVSDELEYCRNAGMNDAIGKPVSEEKLKHLIDKWVFNESEESSNNGKNQTDINVNMRLDLSRVAELMEEDPEFIVSLLGTAIEEIKAQQVKLKTAFSEQDFENLKKSGHKLKGTSSSMGMQILSELARKLEQLNTFSEPNLKNIMSAIDEEIKCVLILAEEKLQDLSD